MIIYIAHSVLFIIHIVSKQLYSVSQTICQYHSWVTAHTETIVDADCYLSQHYKNTINILFFFPLKMCRAPWTPMRSSKVLNPEHVTLLTPHNLPQGWCLTSVVLKRWTPWVCCTQNNPLWFLVCALEFHYTWTQAQQKPYIQTHASETYWRGGLWGGGVTIQRGWEKNSLNWEKVLNA